MKQRTKSKMKTFGVILAISLIIFFAFSSITYLINRNRMQNGLSPVCVIFTLHMNDGGSASYYGIGGQYIYWNRMTGKTEVYLSGYETHFMSWRDLRNPSVELTEGKSIYK